MAAVIGVFHPKWDERPLLVVVKREGAGGYHHLSAYSKSE
jgi:acyl-CoA synthetase (AMP-forming)/AMP-acid ligase II